MQQYASVGTKTLTTEADLPVGRLSIEVYPEFLLRSTGIPFELLTSQRNIQALRAIECYLDAQQTLEDEQALFLNHLWPQALEQAWIRYPHHDTQLKPFYNINRQVRRLALLSPEDLMRWSDYGDPSWPQRWNDLLVQVQRAETLARTTYTDAFLKSRQSLHETFQEQRLQEAVFLSNPGFFERVFSRWAEMPFQASPTKGARQCEIIAHRYLRRFAARCEATSFFGPTLFARLDQAQTAAVQVGTPQSEQVFVETSIWVLNGFSQVLSNHLPPQQSIYARRNPLFCEDTNHRIVCVLNGRSYTLSSEAMALWRLLDGKREPCNIASELGFTQEQLSTFMQELKPFLILRPEVPATEQLPLEYLARYDNEHGPVHQMLTLRDRFAQTPWPQRRAYFTEAERLCHTLGIEARRGQGEHYADRTVFREDRSSPFNTSLSIGQPAVTQMLGLLKAVLPLCFVAALLMREDARDSLRAVLCGREVPLARLASIQIEDKGWRAKKLRASLEDLFRGKIGDGRTIQVSSQEILHVLTPFWDSVIPDTMMACLPGPDLMAAGQDLTSATWVLAELHDDSSSVFGGNPAVLHPDTSGLWTRFQSEVVRLIEPDRMATVISRRRSKHITPELPGVRIELSGRAAPTDYETVPIAHVTVDPDALGVRVGERLLHLYPGDLSSIVHRALALPCATPFSVDLGDFTPRIKIDDYVYQRARWRFELPVSKSGFERWKLFHALRVRYGLPERVYVRHFREPKPFYVDFADPAAVEDLGRLPEGPISVTEMLPDSDQLWWRPYSHPQCSEFRLGTLLHYKKPS
jgi:hypothetical protein